MTITLRQYQEDGLNSIWNYFNSGKTGNPVVAWPTGTGKSLLPAEFIKRVMHYYPTQRFILLTHVKELIEQNYEVVKEVWPNAPIGVYSAGLKSRDIVQPIIYGGIQSMHRIPEAFGHRDIAFIDEAHLVSPEDDTMYMKFFPKLKAINPYLKIIGMSATPYRMGQGLITDGGLFTDICHDITGTDAFNKLIKDGYLCPIIPHKTKTELDVSNVGTQRGEFIANQLQGAVDKAEITWKGLQELVEVGNARNRRSWLLFATGIEHAEHIAAMLMQMGIDCAAVHSKQSGEYNDKAIRAFKNFELRSIVNYGKLTTGFNHPWIDLIGMFRPTLSVALWVQMLGRGTRPAEGKSNCIVMDFAKNVMRLGPINDPAIPKKKGEGGGDIPLKICEICGAYNHIKARFCCDCAEEFIFKTKITTTASREELLRDAPIIETFNVTYVIYNRRQKGEGKPYIIAEYFCGAKSFKQLLFPENHKYPKPYYDWWRQTHKFAIDPPKNTDEVIQHISDFRKPKRIRVHTNKQYPEILSYEY